MPAAEISVGLLGYGYASATFHAPLIAAVPGLRLAAVATRQPERLRADWPESSGVATEPTPQALLARADMELVVIATPNRAHHELAAQALAAGKHVVVDKPFTLTVAEGEDLITRARAANRLLSVFHNRRWDGDFLGLRTLLAGGHLGRLTHFESHFDRFRPQVRPRWRESGEPGSGLWYDLGPHLLDQVLLLLGPPECLRLELASQREGAAPEADDWFHAVLRYPQGLRAILHASALTASVAPRFTLHGTQGSFIKHGLDTQEDALKAGLRPGTSSAAAAWGLDPQPGRLTRMSAAAPGGLETGDWPTAAGDYPAYYAGMRDAIRHGAPNPVPAEQALEVMRWIERGRASAGLG